MVSLNKRTSMALFSDPSDHYSQRVRIVLEEKGIGSEIIDTNRNELSEEILEISPYATLPVLVDRDVCLYDSVTLMEYLDERFPHPPLLPVYPVARANIRLYIKRIERDWSFLFDKIIEKNIKESERNKLRKQLKSLIIATIPIFKEKPFFMNEEFSLVDCCIAPILWRLPLVQIDIPQNVKHKPLNEYMKVVFTRKAFLRSLTEIEKSIRSV